MIEIGRTIIPANDQFTFSYSQGYRVIYLVTGEHPDYKLNEPVNLIRGDNVVVNADTTVTFGYAKQKRG